VTFGTILFAFATFAATFATTFATRVIVTVGTVATF
jgi:hypothetical protein